MERWIFAILRERTFFSLAELNQAIRGLLDRLNSRPFKKLPGNRRFMYTSLDKLALKSLLATACQDAQWKKAKGYINYHVEGERHYYSVTHQLVGKKLNIRYMERTVECFHKSQRVASHRRILEQSGFTTMASTCPAPTRSTPI